MKSIKTKEIVHNWHLVDAKGQRIGRLATDVAEKLMGKNKVYFMPHIDTGDNVVVINAKEAVFSGKKELQKKYYRHSGYPGGLYTKTASQVRSQKPENLIKHAVVGMLPKNKIGRAMVRKLFIFEDDKHPYSNKLTN